MRQDQIHHAAIVPVRAHRQHQRREAAVILGVDFRTGVQQRLGRFGRSEGGGHQQGSPSAEFNCSSLNLRQALRFRDGVDLGAFCHEQLYCLDISVPGGVHQRGQSNESVRRVDVGSGIEQQANCGGVVPESRSVERRNVPLVHNIHLRALSKQEPHNFG